MSELLTSYSISHAGVKPIHHPRLGVQVNGQTAVRYLRFLKPVNVERLELPYHITGRWVPDVPTHPAHLIISILDPNSYRWETVREINLPPDPRILGEGLSQTMTIEQMNAHFSLLLQEPPRVFDLGGIITDHLRVECDREHPIWPTHGECNGGPNNVPFGILDPLKAYGNQVVGQPYIPIYRPLLRQGEFHPDAAPGIRVYEQPGAIVYESDFLKVSFSLRRPMLLHLGWDVLGQGGAGLNRVGIHQRNFLHAASQVGGLSGPLLRTLQSEYGSHLWTGKVDVVGNQVAYRSLTCGLEGLELDAIFTIMPDRLVVELIQTSSYEIPVIEWETWRILWDLRNGMTAAAAQPTLLPGRNGDVQLPMLWASDGNGCLSCQVLEGDETRFQVESYRSGHCLTGGIVLASHPEPDQCLVIPAGKRRSVIELQVTNLEPQSLSSEMKIHPVFQRHWASVYSTFRPEYGGFSNHAAAVNCHVNQHGPLDVVAFTRPTLNGFQPLRLMRFTIERALLDGGGYGYFRNLYLDSDPILISAAGRIHQVDPDLEWLLRIKPGLVEAFERISSNMGDESLVVCRDLSGNSGSFRWSSNAMDVIGFGHIDGYVNAWCYRALRNATALFAIMGMDEHAIRSRKMAESIRENYAKGLLNSETGWIAGWRSLDGKLHDYAFLLINGPAIAFGLLAKDQAIRALNGLEDLRDRVGPGSAEFGLPHNLLPIHPDDHILPRILGSLEPTFERYTDGGLGVFTLNLYIRALSIYGFKARARKLADELSSGYLAGVVTGGMESGVEFHTWEGLPSGYEGTFGPNFAPLYALAIEYGIFKPLEPEWWPAQG